MFPLAPFRSGCVVGRAPDAHLRLELPTISREQFRWMKGSIEPLSNTVPTMVNGRHVETATKLRHGDIVEAGGIALRYLMHEDGLSAGSIPEPTEGQTMVGSFPEPTDIRSIRFREGKTVIGRSGPGIDLPLDHPSISRLHAEVEYGDGRAVLRDLGSSNGTFVNGERILHPRPLRVGDRIDIGPYSLQFNGDELKRSSRDGNLRIVCRDLTRQVRSESGENLTILNNVSLVIEPHEFICILGPTGSGKSTLLDALSARVPADSGDVLYNDVGLYASFDSLKQGIAFVPQQNVLHDDLTQRQALRYTAELRLPPDTSSEDQQQAVESAMERVDMLHRADTKIRSLSGGQKRRVSLANEIVSSPSVLFLDEVTSGLDEKTDWEMMALFRKMAEGGLSVVCVTHTLANVEDFCHKVAVMAVGGSLVHFGTPEETMQHFGIRKLGDLYRKLAEKPAETWEREFVTSDAYRHYIAQVVDSAAFDAVKAPVGPDQKKSLKALTTEALRQYWVLLRRCSRLLTADRYALRLAFGQSLLVGGLLASVFGDLSANDPRQVLQIFFLGISSFWFGANNASKEIVKEILTYRRERDVNLSVVAYVMAKMTVCTILVSLQVVLLSCVTGGLASFPEPLETQLATMILAGAAGVATGLAISAGARTTDQANTLVPMILIPQILLSGAVVNPLPVMMHWAARFAVSGYWIFHGMFDALRNHSVSWAGGCIVLGIHLLIALAVAVSLLVSKDARGNQAQLDAFRKWIDQARELSGTVAQEQTIS